MNLNKIKQEEINDPKLLCGYGNIINEYKDYKKDAIFYGLSASLLVIPVWGNITPNLLSGAVISTLTGVGAFSYSIIKDKVQLEKEIKKFRINYVDSEEHKKELRKSK